MTSTVSFGRDIAEFQPESDYRRDQYRFSMGIHGTPTPAILNEN